MGRKFFGWSCRFPGLRIVMIFVYLICVCQLLWYRGRSWLNVLWQTCRSWGEFQSEFHRGPRLFQTLPLWVQMLIRLQRNSLSKAFVLCCLSSVLSARICFGRVCFISLGCVCGNNMCCNFVWGDKCVFFVFLLPSSNFRRIVHVFLLVVLGSSVSTVFIFAVIIPSSNVLFCWFYYCFREPVKFSTLRGIQSRRLYSWLANAF